MISNDFAVKILAFVGAVFALVGSSEQPITDVKLWLTGIAAGCAAVLAIMRAVGQGTPPVLQRDNSQPPKAPEGGKG